MRIEILNTGTELLLGTTANTHAAWIGSVLLEAGLRTARQTTVPDGPAITSALREVIPRCDALIITGGLGPTSDDLTCEATAGVLGLELIRDEAAMRSLEAFFAHRGRPMAAANLKQALVPVGADVLPNPNGTAPGVYIPPRQNPLSRCAVFLLPGPPRELKPMFHEEVMPRLRSLGGPDNPPSMRVLKFAGIGESDFHQGVDALLAAVPGLETGYCARIGELDLRLIGHQPAIEAGTSIALGAFQEHCFSTTGESLEAVVVRLLANARLTLATAESCTGGLISHRITNVPGASEVFHAGFVTYSNQAKISMLGVSRESLEQQGAVSRQVVREMAAGALRASNASIAVAVSGIAGPGGGTIEKPVGTAWIGVAHHDGRHEQTEIYQPRNRADFKLAVSQLALDRVRKLVNP